MELDNGRDRGKSSCGNVTVESGLGNVMVGSGLRVGQMRLVAIIGNGYDHINGYDHTSPYYVLGSYDHIILSSIKDQASFRVRVRVTRTHRE